MESTQQPATPKPQPLKGPGGRGKQFPLYLEQADQDNLDLIEKAEAIPRRTHAIRYAIKVAADLERLKKQMGVGADLSVGQLLEDAAATWKRKQERAAAKKAAEKPEDPAESGPSTADPPSGT